MFAFVPWLASVFGSLIGWFLTWFSRRAAIRWAVISMVIGLTVALTAAMSSLILAIQYAMPGGWVALGMSLIPGNAPLCLSAYVTSIVLRWVYDYKMGLVGRWLDQGL